MNEPPDQPPVHIPSDVTVTCDTDVMSFLLYSNEFKDKVDRKLERQHGKIAWPSRADDNVLVRIQCTLAGSIDTATVIAGCWQEVVTHSWQTLVGQIKKEEISFLLGIKDEFSDKVDALPSKMPNSVQVGSSKRC